MKPISVRMVEPEYDALKGLAKGQGRSISDIVRKAIVAYLTCQRGPRRSIVDIAPHSSGPLKRTWTRTQLVNEMSRRGSVFWTPVSLAYRAARYRENGYPR